MAKSNSSMPGCTARGASALAFLAFISWLLGVVPRPRKQKDGSR